MNTRQTQVINGRQLKPIIFNIPKTGLFRVSIVVRPDTGVPANAGLYLIWTNDLGEVQIGYPDVQQALKSSAGATDTVVISAQGGTTAQFGVTVFAGGEPAGSFTIRAALELVSEG